MIIGVFIISMLAGIAIGLPIAMSLLLCAVCTAMAMGGGAANPTIIARTLMQGSDSVTMMALPFFILAGEIMNQGGLTKRIIAFCNIFLGRVRGGLGYRVPAEAGDKAGAHHGAVFVDDISIADNMVHPHYHGPPGKCRQTRSEQKKWNPAIQIKSADFGQNGEGRIVQHNLST